MSISNGRRFGIDCRDDSVESFKRWVSNICNVNSSLNDWGDGKDCASLLHYLPIWLSVSQPYFSYFIHQFYGTVLSNLSQFVLFTCIISGLGRISSMVVIPASSYPKNCYIYIWMPSSSDDWCNAIRSSGCKILIKYHPYINIGKYHLPFRYNFDGTNILLPFGFLFPHLSFFYYIDIYNKSEFETPAFLHLIKVSPAVFC